MPKKSSKQSKTSAQPQKTMNIAQVLQLANQHYGAGQWQQAQILCEQVLQIEPENSVAFYLLGLIEMQRHNNEAALVLLQKAIQFNPAVPAYYGNLGTIFQKQGNLTEALKCYQQIIVLEPHSIQAHNNIGAILKAQGKWTEAIEYYQRALAINPKEADTYNNLGNLFYEQGQLNKALEAYQQALTLKPNYIWAYNNLSRVLRKQGQLAEAITCCQQAIQLKPDFAPAYNNQALAFSEQNEFIKAVDCLHKALNLNPNYAEAYCNLGIILQKQGKLSEAMNSLQRAIALKPDFNQAHNNLGSVLTEMGRISEAINHYRKALAQNPSQPIHSNLLLSFDYRILDTDTFLNEHQRFNEQYAKPLAALIKPFLNDRASQRKLKIGYISPDFHQHVVSHFVEPILAHHNHQQFDIFCYYTNLKIDKITKHLQQYADHWRNCFGLLDEELVAQIRQDQIDILVDLSGHTYGKQLLILARKPAPLQMTYLGYPNTTGLTAIDYRITDSYAEPPGIAESLSTETLLRMPKSYFCYWPAKESPLVNKLPASQKGYITFGSFNKFAKLSEEVLELWAQVLKAVPNAKLLIKAKSLNDRPTQKALQAQLAKLGIEAERLILVTYAPSTQAHLQTYYQVDIGLDSYPYNGATTTCEALWMGVPVVTLVGERHAARMGFSILSALGLTELIAHTPDEYVQICIKLANDINYLQKFRQKIRTQMQASPLMDGATFTHHLETNYQQVWEKWCNQTKALESKAVALEFAGSHMTAKEPSSDKSAP